MNEQGVLGQRTRKTNIDYGLADRLNKLVAEQIEKEKKENKLYRISPGLALQREEKSYDEWVDYWKKVKDGRVMMSIADAYGMVRQLDNPDCNKAMQQQANQLEYYLATNDLVFDTQAEFCQATTVIAKITHNNSITQLASGSNRDLVREILVNIPPYEDARIMDVLGEPEGLKFIQAFFGTQDDAEKIRKNLSCLSQGTRPEMIRVWTPRYDERRERDKWFCYICHDDFFNLGLTKEIYGSSIGVRIKDKGGKK